MSLTEIAPTSFARWTSVGGAYSSSFTSLLIGGPSMWSCALEFPVPDPIPDPRFGFTGSNIQLTYSSASTGEELWVGIAPPYSTLPATGAEGVAGLSSLLAYLTWTPDAGNADDRVPSADLGTLFSSFAEAHPGRGLVTMSDSYIIYLTYAPASSVVTTWDSPEGGEGPTLYLSTPRPSFKFFNFPQRRGWARDS